MEYSPQSEQWPLITVVTLCRHWLPHLGQGLRVYLTFPTPTCSSQAPNPYSTNKENTLEKVSGFLGVNS